ncbi:heparan-alpha-glucosaminide N-acetyltransferase domain-containing protein [Anaerococcus porci]|uniref:heparan-alpha-glucosaminide N-acetyltransferase domain-containing protein n=1 Tax=Anaerococcus porci TaxID=2652269 RepID=UPI002A74FEDA|nr:heparan-alpha-glucosaminide N-acetyltransferase domain-containing protein [Anaerococcus porci]MDY3006115.1 heparan-alpha-glucosaminide N-acetyltransferase domain-containing protein [Anaerococcus porci]
MKRIYNLDKFRGFTIISMVLFHLCYDINLYIDLGYYNNILINKIWQLSIAVSFFLVSGISSNFLSSCDNIVRGIKTSILGFLVTTITYIFVKDQLIIFGVLNCLGISMIITGIIKKYINLDKKFWWVFIILFILTYSVPHKRILSLTLPSSIYEMNLFFLGFPSNSFYSTDYFPIIPWVFIFISGYLMGKILIQKNFYNLYGKDNLLAKIGQHSIQIYLFHQPILYILVYLFFKLKK